MMKALLLYSSKPGKNNTQKLLDKIVKKLSVKYEITTKECPSLNDFKSAIQSSNNFDALFILGGDGTLNNAINEISTLYKEDRPIIGYIPTGTLNDAGKTFGIRGVSKAIKIILEGNIEDIDIGKCNDRYFLYLAAIGQYSDISYIAKQDEKKRVGKLSYYRLAIIKAFQKHSIKINIEYDGRNEEYLTPFLIVMNGKYVGGFKINPKNSIRDGLFDIYITKPGLFNGLTHYFPFKTKTKHIQTSSLKVSINNSEPWCLDGEKYISGPVDISIERSAIKIFTKKR